MYRHWVTQIIEEVLISGSKKKKGKNNHFPDEKNESTFSKTGKSTPVRKRRGSRSWGEIDPI